MDDDTGVKILVVAVFLALMATLSTRGGGSGDVGAHVSDGRAWAERWQNVCHVQGIVDGDTVLCNDSTLFRLTLVDAPETGFGPIGQEARSALGMILPPGSKARIELDQQAEDEHGRVHGYLYTRDGYLVNESMVGTGYAVPWVIEPNTLYRSRIERAGAYARQQNSGLWGEGAFECFVEGGGPQDCSSAP